jgi:hypothetical protein
VRIPNRIYDDLLELRDLLAPAWTSIEESIDGPVALKTNAGNDFQADVMGGGTFTGDTGTSTTAPTATTFTCDGKAYTTNALAGHVVQRAGVYGVVLSNTATVLTIDKWYDPTNPGGAAASTPAAGQYVILPGGGPGFWMALSTDATAPAATDTTLTSEVAAGGLNRKLATYGHTAGANSYTLSTTFTQTDSTARTINKLGIFNAQNGGRLVFETAVPNPPVLAAVNDAITPTETVTT